MTGSPVAEVSMTEEHEHLLGGAAAEDTGVCVFDAAAGRAVMPAHLRLSTGFTTGFTAEVEGGHRCVCV
jgi:hypothetical protein